MGSHHLGWTHPIFHLRNTRHREKYSVSLRLAQAVCERLHLLQHLWSDPHLCFLAVAITPTSSGKPDLHLGESRWHNLPMA